MIKSINLHVVEVDRFCFNGVFVAIELLTNNESATQLHESSSKFITIKIRTIKKI